MAAGWRDPVFTPADELRGKADATEGTWSVTYDYEDGLPPFTYAETFPRGTGQSNTPWGPAKYSAFATRAKTAKSAFDVGRTTVTATLASAKTAILAALNTQG